jgi:enoyl-CoA hydratase/carnithine racemase
MSYEHIRYSVDGPVALVTIAREQVRNALSSAVNAEIAAALRTVEHDPALTARRRRRTPLC